MTSTRVAALAAVGVIVGIAAFAAATLETYQKVGYDSVDVILTTVGGECRAVEPGVLGGPNGRQITWRVRNVGCDTPQYIVFRDYRPIKIDGTPDDPENGVVAPDPTPAAGPIAQGASVQPVNATIAKKKWFSDQIFKYSICIGTSPQTVTSCIDPYIDVWP